MKEIVLTKIDFCQKKRLNLKMTLSSYLVLHICQQHAKISHDVQTANGISMYLLLALHLP